MPANGYRKGKKKRTGEHPFSRAHRPVAPEIGVGFAVSFLLKFSLRAAPPVGRVSPVVTWYEKKKK